MSHKPKLNKYNPKISSQRNTKNEPKTMDTKQSNNWLNTLWDKTENFFNHFGLVILLIVVVALIVAIFKDFLFHKYAFLFKDIGSDTLNIYYPGWISFGEDTSRWSFYEGMGQRTGGISTIFVSWIYTPWLWLFKPFAWISTCNQWNILPFNIVTGQAYNLILISFFSYLYFRTFGFSGYISFIGSLLFTFSGYIILGSTWYHTGYGLFFIFLLFAFEQLLKKDNWIFLPFAYFLLSSYLYFLYGIFLIFYSIFRYFDDKEVSIKSIKGYIILGIKVVFLAGVGIGLNAANFITNLYTLMESPRGSGIASYAVSLKDFPIFGLEKPIHYFTALMRLFSSDLMGNGNFFKGWHNYLEAPVFYCGLLPLLLISQIFKHINLQKKLIYGGFLAIWTIVVVFPFFRYAIYNFTGDYYKQAIDFFVPISILVVSFSGLNYILKNNKKVDIIILGITFVVVLFALYLPNLLSHKEIVDLNLQSTIRNIIFIFSILLIGLNYTQTKLIAKILLPIVVIVELFILSDSTINNRLPVPISELNQRIGFNDYTKEAVQYIRSNNKNFFRTEKDYSSGTAMHRSLNDAKVQNYYGTANYSSFNQGNYIRFLMELNIINEKDEIATRWAPGLKSRPLLMSLASVKYMLSKSEKSDYIKFGFLPKNKINDVYIYENPFFIPLGFTYDQIMSRSTFKTMPHSLKDFILLRSCVVEDSLIERFQKSFQTLDTAAIHPDQFSFKQYMEDVNNRKQDTLNITYFSHHLIKGEINTQKQKILFFSIPYDPGWRLKVDGQEKQILQLNIGFSGFIIEPGTHKIELEFIALGTELAGKITGIVFFIYMGIILFMIYMKRQFFIDLFVKIKKYFFIVKNKLIKTPVAN
jgi:hypothetical protein